MVFSNKNTPQNRNHYSTYLIRCNNTSTNLKKQIKTKSHRIKGTLEVKFTYVTFPFEMTGAKRVKSEENINTVVSQKN